MLQRADCEEFRADSSLPADITYELLPLEPGMPNEWDQPIIQRREGDHVRAYLNEELLAGVTAGYFLSRVGASDLLPEKGRFILHASYIVYEGRAILFTAPSETGKSTQAHFWEKYRGARIVNEDRVIISEDNGVYYAHGCWATGTAGVTHNVTAPIRAIVILGQGAENRVKFPSAIEKLTRLVPQCSFDSSSVISRIQIIDMVSNLVANVPIVAFDCLNHMSAVEELERFI